MMKRSIPIVLTAAAALTLLQGCATASPFRPASTQRSGYGYTIKEDGSKWKTATFFGNEQTSSSQAMSYSLLAAFEHCQRTGQLALTDSPVDGSFKETYTSVQSTPIYYKGKIVSNSVSSYPVTNVYPHFSSTFFCFSHFHQLAGPELTESIGRELVHPVTKDFKGGLLVKQVNAENPAGLKVSDVITAVHGERVESKDELFDVLQRLKPGPADLTVVRAEKVIKVRGEVVDDPKNLKEKVLSLRRMLCLMAEDPSEIHACQSYVSAAKREEQGS